MRSTSLLGKGLSLLLAGLLSAGCLGTGSGPEGEPYVPPVATPPDSIGYFLAEYDKSLRRWTDLKLAPSTERDMRMLRALDANLTKRAVERKDELVTALETGPPMNREVAAVALGFTHDPATLSPLLAGLSDPNPKVVQKVLLGLGILESAETPAAKIVYLLETSSDPWTRNNAAFALQRIVAAGARDDTVAQACRTALIDDEPGVRAQSASILGILRDPESIQQLGDLLHDEVNLVFQAAAAALARIGREHLDKKGEVARLLVDAMDRVARPQRIRLHGELVLLADRNLGEETDPWREWAYRMP